MQETQEIQAHIAPLGKWKRTRRTMTYAGPIRARMATLSGLAHGPRRDSMGTRILPRYGYTRGKDGRIRERQARSLQKELGVIGITEYDGPASPRTDRFAGVSFEQLA